jgi:hypothetical protein
MKSTQYKLGNNLSKTSGYMLTSSEQFAKQNNIFVNISYCSLLTAIGLMPGGSVYKEHTINKETAHLTEIARIFTVQFKYMNMGVP